MQWPNDLAFFPEVLVQLLRLFYAFIEEEIDETGCELMSDSCTFSKCSDSINCSQLAYGDLLAHGGCIQLSNSQLFGREQATGLGNVSNIKRWVLENCWWKSETRWNLGFKLFSEDASFCLV